MFSFVATFVPTTVATIALAFALFGATPAHAAATPACKPQDLRMSLDGRDGDFNGMSHAGTALVILNMHRACSLPGMLPIEFHDARGMKLPVQIRNAAGARPAGMRLERGHRAQMTLRWVAGPVYANSRSGKAVDVSIKLGGADLSAPLHAELYGEAGQPIYVERSALHAFEVGIGKRQ